VLLDASGSMSMYTGVFLRFIHGVLDEFREAEAFMFHTRLAYVSDAMKEKDAARALDRLSIMAQGAAAAQNRRILQTFNRWHAARVLHSRSCVMIVSDGYETGDAALLGREMAALAKRCRRIVWLNPMMAWEGYAPEALGIKAALPYVDLYAPANTLKSLTELEPYLASSEERRHDRHVEVMDLVARLKAAEETFVLRHRGENGVGDRGESRRQGHHPPDGTIVAGWIGGGCARGAVLKAARDALADGEPRMVSVQPENSARRARRQAGENRGGVRFARTCARARAPWTSLSSRCCRIPRWSFSAPARSRCRSQPKRGNSATTSRSRRRLAT
jgi:hypothetical protein